MITVVTTPLGIVTVPVTVMLPLASLASTTSLPAIGVLIDTKPPIGATVSISKLNDGD